MIYNEDCLEGMKRIPDGSVNLICTDPPYCVGATSNGSKATFGDFNLMRPFWELSFAEWCRVLKDGSHVYLCTDWRTYPFLYPLVLKYFCVKNLIVWRHGQLRPGNWYRGSHELIIFATKGKSVRQFGGGERDLWEIASDVATFRRFHPAQKPVALMEQMIKNSSSEGQTVLDPFMGSGSTGIACVNLNRKFIGFELEEQFFRVAEKRIGEAQIGTRN